MSYPDPERLPPAPTVTLDRQNPSILRRFAVRPPSASRAVLFLLLAATLVATLAGVGPALAQPAEPVATAAQAMAAYERGDMAECARVFGEMHAADALDSPNAAYNAACCSALAGRADAAFRFLDLAIDEGYRDAAHGRADSDLSSLHGDRRWGPFVERLEQAEREYLSSIHTELYELYHADQGDRRDLRAGKTDWQQVGERDEQRRARVLELIEAGELEAADDYYHAAMVFQHGSDSESYLRAKNLAAKAAELDPENRSARWLMAAATDRHLLSLDQPQIYGTQYRRENDGPWTLEPIDREAVTDEQRQALGVPTLAEAEARLERMNEELEASAKH